MLAKKGKVPPVVLQHAFLVLGKVRHRIWSVLYAIQCVYAAVVLGEVTRGLLPEPRLALATGLLATSNTHRPVLVCIVYVILCWCCRNCRSFGNKTSVGNKNRLKLNMSARNSSVQQKNVNNEADSERKRVKGDYRT